MNVRLRGISLNRLATFVLASYVGYCSQASGQSVTSPPSIAPGRIVPIYSNVNTIQPGEWVSIFGTNLAGSTASSNGAFPTSLAGTSVTIDGKAGYLIYVSPTQINLQAPNDIAIGPVPVVVMTAGGNANSTVTLAEFGPSFSLFDTRTLRASFSGRTAPELRVEERTTYLGPREIRSVTPRSPPGLATSLNFSVSDSGRPAPP